MSHENETALFFFEEHPLMVLGIQALLKKEPGLRLAGHSNNPHRLADSLKKTRPDLLLIDLTLYNRESFDFLRKLRKAFPHLKIILLSVHTNAGTVDKAIATGINGYVLKRDDPTGIIEAIHAVRNGKEYLSKQIGQDSQKLPAPIDSPINLLSRQQFQILQRIGKGETSRQIAGELEIPLQTVDDQSSAIQEKLGLSNPSELLQFAFHWVHHEGGFV